MWFFFGIVSFVGFFAYRLWRKLYWSWGWPDDKGYLRLKNRPYKTRYRANDGNHQFSYAVTCPPGFYFRIKRETRWDRWAKRIGLSVEHELADADFDKNLYLVSNDPAWCAELSAITPLRNLIKAMFHDKNLFSITCEGRHLWADVRLQSAETPQTYLNGIPAQNIISALHAVADSLEAITEQYGTRTRDPYALRAIALASLASAILVLAGMEILRIFWLERSQVMIDGMALFGFSMLIAITVLFLWLVIGAAWLRGSSYAHIIMLEILLSGGLGLSGSSYALLRDINHNLDMVAPTPYTVTVTHKKTGHRRKYGTYYTLYFDTSGTTDIPLNLEVSHKTYAKATIGDPLTIFVKPGYLGYRWIETITPHTSRKNP